jgi:hypothetical protein
MNEKHQNQLEQILIVKEELKDLININMLENPEKMKKTVQNILLKLILIPSPLEMETLVNGTKDKMN